MSSQESFQATNDVQHNTLLASEVMSPLDLFIRELDERKGRIPSCQEVTEIQTSVENTLKHLLLEVEKENPFFKTTLINSGSFYEGTKVGQPDEFDYFVQLDYFSEPEAIVFKELPLSTVVVIPSELGITKLLKLTPSKFHHYFRIPIDGEFDWKTWVKAPFVEIFNDKAEGFEAYGIKALSHNNAGAALKRHGPAYCLELEWRGGERYRGLKISVDLSLAVRINSRSSSMDLDLETSAGKVIKSSLDSLPYYFAVSSYRNIQVVVPSGCEESKGGFHLRCSQSCLEQALFHHFGPDSGPSVCLRVLKVLRDISFPSDNQHDTCFRSMESLADLESVQHSLRNALPFGPDLGLSMLLVLIDVSAFSEKDELFSKWISSYVLKTLVLFEWEENPAEEQWAGSNLSDRLLNILNNLVHCLKKGSLRSFFYKDYNVLPKEEIYNFKTHPVHRITILYHWILSIRNASKYKFGDCLKDIFNEVKLTCQKITLTHILSKGLERHFHQELNQVITRTTKETDSIRIFQTYIFCDIYIQALLNKIAPEEKLILVDVKQIKETVSLRSLWKGIELFKDIADTRIKGLENLPSYSVWTQEFKSAGNEIAKLFEFLFSFFKKDVEILLNKLEQS